MTDRVTGPQCLGPVTGTCWVNDQVPPAAEPMPDRAVQMLLKIQQQAGFLAKLSASESLKCFSYR